MSQLPPPKLSRQYLPLTRCTPCIPRVLCCSKHFDAAVIEYEQQGPLYQSHAGSAVQDYCTLVTQCSLDRWPRFTQQAEAWDGPVSVAVYIPTLRTSASARIADQLLQGYCEQYTKQHPTQCVTVSALYANHFAREGASALQQSGATDSSIRVQHSAADLPTYDQLYPINALRNLALQQASSPLILTADADLIPSSNLHRILQQPSTLQLLGHDIYHHHQQQLPDSGLTEQQPQQQQQYNSSDTPGPVMLVLPVFEMSTQQEIPDTDTAEVPRTKAELVAALTAGTAQPFHCGVFAPSHQPVDLQTWLAASEVYEVQYVEYFEPQGVAVKQQLPAYDERFRGYGLNKVQHAWHMNALGYRFKVLPDAFMVTSPHKRSSSWRPLPGTARDEAHLARIKDVYEMFKQDISDKC